MSRSAEIDAYIAALENPDRRAALTRLRDVAHEAVPGVAESLDYSMPTFSKDGQVVCSLASQKHHMSLYTCGQVVLDAFAKELAGFNCGKGCVRFKKDADMPSGLAKRIIERAAEVAAAQG